MEKTFLEAAEIPAETMFIKAEASGGHCVELAAVESGTALRHSKDGTAPGSVDLMMCPGFGGVGLVDFSRCKIVEGDHQVPKPYPAEFRRRVLDLVRAGRTVTAVATDLGISDQTIYNWRRQERIDSGQLPGITSTDHAELVEARKRIVVLEAEPAVHRRAAELLKEAVPPKARFVAIATMTSKGLPTQTACRVLDVTDSGFYAWRNRPLSARVLRHTWLSEQIRQIHTDSRGTYGFRRMHAELILGRGIAVGHNAVKMLMRRAGLKGLPGTKSRRTRPETACAADLVDPAFTRQQPNQLWVTDITEHPTREGKIYCAVVLDVYSRRVVGWSIDSSQTANLVTNALSMSIENRRPAGTFIHSDHGTQGGLNRSSQHLVIAEVFDATTTQQADRALRPAMRSPGRPIPARHVERAFWRLIAQGKRTEDAAIEIRVSVPVASRWFRHAGGMPPLSLAEPSGRYLSFHEREEITLLKAQSLVSARSPGSWAVIPARSRESCDATPPPGPGNATTGHRSHNGRHRPRLAGRSR